MILEKSSTLALFNDQASQLVQLHPGVQEEVGWQVTHLNAKWDSILSILEPSDCGHCEQDYCLGRLLLKLIIKESYKTIRFLL